MSTKLALVFLLLTILIGCNRTTTIDEERLKLECEMANEVINEKEQIIGKEEEINCGNLASVVQKGELKKIDFFKEKNYALIESVLVEYESDSANYYAYEILLIGVDSNGYYFSNNSGEGLTYYYYDKGTSEYTKYNYFNEAMLASTLAKVYEGNIYVVVIEGGNRRLMQFKILKINIRSKNHEVIYENKTNWVPDFQIVDNYLTIAYVFTEEGKTFSQVIAIDLENENKSYEIYKTSYHPTTETRATGRFIAGFGGGNATLYFQVVTLKNQNLQLGEGDFYSYKYDFKEKKIVERIVLPRGQQFIAGSGDVFIETIATFGTQRPLRYRATSLYVKNDGIYDKYTIHYSHSHNPLFLAMDLDENRLIAYNSNTMWLIDHETLEYDKVKFRISTLHDKGISFSNPFVYNESIFYSINNNGIITVRELRPVDISSKVDLSIMGIRVHKDKEKQQESEYQEVINIQITDVDLSKEHVIVKNFGSENIHIGGWKLVHMESNSIYTFPIGYILLSGVESLVVYGSDAEETLKQLKWEGLNICESSSGSISLYDNNDNLISTFD